MTTTHDTDQQQPETPVVHLSRRAALEAERAAAGKPARRSRAPRPSRSDAVLPAAAASPAPEHAATQAPAPHTVPVTARGGRRATQARATTEHVDARITRVVRRPSAALPAAAAPSARGARPARSHRASRITLTSAVAALAMFAASAMPAHASAGTSLATSTLAPQVRTQDYAVTQAVTAAALDRDDFTVGGGQQVVVAGDGGAEGAVSYGGEVRSPFPGPVRMSSGFGYRSAPCGACSSLHQGLDFNPGMGAPIGAVAAGKVRVSGTYFSYGTTVIIDHVIEGRRVSTLYGHMIPGSSPLRAGDTVEAGQFIGSVGSSGVSTGAHLHLEVLMDGVTPIDPEAWLEARIGRSLTI
ncbi:M23 family metallopeptidase [Curtobacterium sp. MCSS17_007]|uniref:M23 family metallopeptidase n=1 Tax=Curtobacterium sp. MCSS17_007 TaxID=2175646 RepID=UPI000DA82E79|nr:M23 family metallopeptidase [Curtobacterium sp. MCSS17_007]WIE75605.1 M23 family metallopeptidase [Curtobacterium sp. MCSS17_007]